MFKVGEIVHLPDLTKFSHFKVYGVIEAEKAESGITIYSVRTLSGSLYSRDDFEIESTTADDVKVFRQDMLNLGPHHSGLKKAASLLA